jgi:predicted nucleic acid-binding protein
MTQLLLDTNVISEVVKPQPDFRVMAFLEQLQSAEQFTAAICIAEIRYGLERMPAGQKQDQKRAAIATFLSQAFSGRILPFDGLCAELYGKIRNAREASGQPISIEDAMIAATAQAHSLTLATRNIKDFEGCGIRLLNPWETT